VGRRVLAAVALVAALVPSAFAAEEPAAPPAPPDKVDSETRNLAPAGEAPKTLPERNLRVGLKEAVALALKNNLDLRADSLGPGIAAATLRESESLYDHLFTSRVVGGERKQPVASTFVGDGTEIHEDVVTAAMGIRRLLPTGGSISLDAGLDRTLTNSTLYQINPYYDSAVTLNLVQPLLRGAGRARTESGIRFARDAKDIADLEFRSRTEDLVRSVETTYWSLVQARGDVEARAKGVSVAEDLLRISEARLAAGAGTRVDVSQAAAGVAARRVEFLRAENAARSFEENLLGLLFPRTPDAPSGEPMRVETSDEPAKSLPPLPQEEPEAAVARALVDRSDLRIQRATVDQAQVGVLIAESDSKVQLNFEGSFGYRGVESNAGNSFSQSLAQREWATWSVGLFLEVPLGNRAARARVDRALLVREQTEARVRALESTASVRVRNSRRDLESTRRQIDAARRATELAEEQLEAEKERLRNDKSTTFEVLRLESDLTDARRSEIRALVDYLISCVQYDYELGRVLESRGLAPERK
jgi:outer membrane protein